MILLGDTPKKPARGPDDIEHVTVPVADLLRCMSALGRARDALEDLYHYAAANVRPADHEAQLQAIHALSEARKVQGLAEERENDFRTMLWEARR